MYFEFRQGCRDAIHALMVFMKLIVTELVIDPHADEGGAADAQRESKDVDERKTFLTQQVSDRDHNVVSNHNRPVCLAKTHKYNAMLHGPK